MPAERDWEEDLAYALEQANELPLGPERERVLKTASELKRAACMVRWIDSAQLRSPRKYQQ